MSLSSYQSRQIRRFNTLDIFFSDPVSVIAIALQPNLVTEVALFHSKFLGLKQLVPQKNFDDAVGITKDHNELKHTIALEGEFITLLGGQYAKKVNDTNLISLLNLRETDFIRMKDGDVFPTVKRIYDKLNPLVGNTVFDSYKITKPQLDKLLADATAFDAAIGKNTTVSNLTSTINDDINTTITEIIKVIDEIEPYMVFYKTSNNTFYKNFYSNKEVPHTGVHHSGIMGTVTLGGKVVDGAIVTDVKAKTSITADSAGNYKKYTKNGDKLFKFSTPDGTTSKTVNVHIEYGVITNLDVDL